MADLWCAVCAPPATATSASPATRSRSRSCWPRWKTWGASYGCRLAGSRFQAGVVQPATCQPATVRIESMKLFAGLSRTDYEDVFRAIGALIDERGWSNVSVMEVDEGLVVQVMVKANQRETKPRLETYLLTDSDLERVMRDAVGRRRKREAARQPAIVKPPDPPTDSSAPPPPGRPADNHLAARFGPAPVALASADDDLPPLPPMPALDGLPSERPLSAAEVIDEPP